MMKNSLRRIVTTVITATTIGSFSSIGVSAATFDSNINNYYNTFANKILNIDSTMTNNINYYLIILKYYRGLSFALQGVEWYHGA